MNMGYGALNALQKRVTFISMLSQHLLLKSTTAQTLCGVQRGKTENASVVYDIDSYSWNDQEWLSKRDKCYEKPMNIYEVHFGSWRIKEGKEETDRFYTYEE